MSGTVKGSILDPDSKAMANCQLFMYRRTDGTLLGSTVSDQNGAYELTHTALDGEKVFVVCLDNDDSPDFEGLVCDRITIKDKNLFSCDGAIPSVEITILKFTTQKFQMINLDDLVTNKALTSTPAYGYSDAKSALQAFLSSLLDLNLVGSLLDETSDTFKISIKNNDGQSYRRLRLSFFQESNLILGTVQENTSSVIDEMGVSFCLSPNISV